MAVGVPEMEPVEVEKERPDGSEGEIDHAVTAPPLVVGVTVVMVVSLVRVSELGVYVMDDGATSLIWMVTVAVPLPPALVAVTM